MAASTVEHKAMVLLSLTPQEAYFLKSYMQNGFTEEEHPEISESRINIFKALPGFDELSKY